MRLIMKGSVGAEQLAGFLLGVTARGPTVDELVGFATVMREFAVPVRVEDDKAIDLCGTGGDGKGTFNVSTAAALVCAGAGVTVAKHGNRSVSSSCGSADVLEALGVKADLGKQGVESCLDSVGIGFIFAPRFHPAMKHVMPVRRALGVRTFFNILGPLCNPGGVRRQLVGAFSSRAARTMAEILVRLDADHVVAVHSRDGLDEVSVAAPTTIFEYVAANGGTIAEHEFRPDSVGIKMPEQPDIGGGSAKQNAAILESILSGDTGPARDITLVNAAHGIYVGGQATDIRSAMSLAAESVDSGAASDVLDRLRKASHEAPTS